MVCIRVILVFLLLLLCRVHLEKDLRHDVSLWTGVIQPLTQSTQVKLKNSRYIMNVHPHLHLLTLRVSKAIFPVY